MARILDLYTCQVLLHGSHFKLISGNLFQHSGAGLAGLDGGPFELLACDNIGTVIAGGGADEDHIATQVLYNRSRTQAIVKHNHSQHRAQFYGASVS